MLLDDPVALFPLDHRLDVGRLVVRRDNESSRVTPHLLVFLHCQRPDALEAEWIRALANETIDPVPKTQTLAKRLCDVRDSLVHLAEERLVLCKTGCPCFHAGRG